MILCLNSDSWWESWCGSALEGKAFCSFRKSQWGPKASVQGVCVCVCVLISRRCRARWAKSMLTCCLWCASTRIFIGLWSQKALSIFLVEIRVLYSLGRGQKQDPKRRHYKCLEMDGMVQATGPVIPKSSCHQKHMKQLFGIFVCFKFFLFFFKFFLHLGY